MCYYCPPIIKNDPNGLFRWGHCHLPKNTGVLNDKINDRLNDTLNDRRNGRVKMSIVMSIVMSKINYQKNSKIFRFLLSVDGDTATLYSHYPHVGFQWCILLGWEVGRRIGRKVGRKS